jgi:uncharacterized protein
MMIILLSPSKTMRMVPYVKKSRPEFIKEAKLLAAEYTKYSIEEIQSKMKVSLDIARKTAEMFKNILFEGNLTPALLAYTGTVYRDVDVNNYSKDDWNFAQQNLRILSGLYGVLKPFDIIQKYRLEMKLVSKFWSGKIIFEDTVVNLASQEYFSATICKGRVITPVFKENKGGYKKITIYTKFARGTMANWIIKNKITEPTMLKEFNEDGYLFNESMSNEDELVFTRG